jgi:hypothetical protein
MSAPLKINALRAADLMRAGSTMMQMHAKDGLRWYITPGAEITEHVAKQLLGRPDVQPGGDGLFPGISQTFKLRGLG